jgi:gamma-glutamyltranspeptidase / glutathione hydrolase
MRVISNKKASPSIPARAGGFALACVALALVGCGGPQKPVGTVGHVTCFGGLVAADEPRAVIAARDVLSAGGTAADAAVTLYFSLAVTLPSTASLGGGGSCVAYDVEKKMAQVIDFPSTGSIPANPRGFYALHAKFGKLRWESLLIEPERLARSGVTVSRAFANDLARGATTIAGDPEARRVFFRPDGKVLAEGDRMVNMDLSAVLASLRRAPGEFYSGNLARDMAQRAGGSFSAEDLRDFRPQVGQGTSIAIGHDVAIVSGESGEAVSAMLQRGVTERLQLVSTAANSRAQAPGTGFVVVDSYGNGVACAVGNNALFGNGRVVPGTGMIVAAPATGGQSLAAGLVVNRNSQEVHFGAAGGGGVSPATALAVAMVAGADHGEKAEATLVAAGTGLPPGGASRLNTFACPEPKHCSVATDPAGFGYALVVGRD